jgi:hypothetical protein
MCYKKHAKMMLTRANNRCQCCGIPGDLAELGLDHVIPQSKGGSDEVENLQVLCGACNNLKSDHLVPAFGIFEPISDMISVNFLILTIKNRQRDLGIRVKQIREMKAEQQKKDDIKLATKLLKSGKRGSTVRNHFKRQRYGELRISAIIKAAKKNIQNVA